MEVRPEVLSRDWKLAFVNVGANKLNVWNKAVTVM